MPENRNAEQAAAETLHFDMYDIHWHEARMDLVARVYQAEERTQVLVSGNRSIPTFEEAKDCWAHGHSYVFYTQPHVDGECPPAPTFSKSTES